MKKIILPLIMLLLIAAVLPGCGGGSNKSTLPAGSQSASVSGNKSPTPAPTIDPDDIRTPIGKLVVHFIDVGNGEAILIQTPNSKYALIDGGRGDQGAKLSSYITNLGIKKIDTVIVSYPQEDRMGALSSVIDNFKIGKVYMPRIGSDNPAFNSFLSSLSSKDILPETIKSGSTIQLDDEVALSVLAPILASYDFSIDYTLVSRLVYRNNSFLLTGGATELVESQLLGQDASAVKADVLKIGNYGAYNSTTAAFLAAVAPKSAVLFAASGTAGLPDQELLYRLGGANVDLYRTDEGGTVIAESDGDKITFNRTPVAKAVK